MSIHRSLHCCVLVATALLTWCAAVGAPPSTPALREETAESPGTWLVLYNANCADSVAWKDWYLAQWNIPAENALGLDVDPNQEKILSDVFQTQIFLPVRNYIDSDPILSQRILGILVGYRVPGNFYQDATHPYMQGGGGWSVSNNLQDLSSVNWYKRPNAAYFVALVDPPPERLTRGLLAPDRYLTARIDGPTLADAQALTLRARDFLFSGNPVPRTNWIYYDWYCPEQTAGTTWCALRDAVENPVFNAQAGRFPWRSFESDAQATARCAFRFSYYCVSGWNLRDWGGTPSGQRLLGYALNSYGATTVRSTTAHGGRYVPNALVNGGFAAAIGATAEPFVNNQPDPSTLLWCLADGRTLGEAFFHANPYQNYMWELVGDPLLYTPLWFDEEPGWLGPPDTWGPTERDYDDDALADGAEDS